MNDEFYSKTIKKLKVLEKLLKKEYITIRKDMGDEEVIAEINNDVRVFLSAQLEMILNPSMAQITVDVPVKQFTPEETRILKEIAKAAMMQPAEDLSELQLEPESAVEVASAEKQTRVTPTAPTASAVPTKAYRGVVMPEGFKKASPPPAPPKKRKPNHLKNVPEGTEAAPVAPPAPALTGISSNQESPIAKAFKGWNIDPNTPVKERIATIKALEKQQKDDKK